MLNGGFDEITGLQTGDSWRGDDVESRGVGFAAREAMLGYPRRRLLAAEAGFPRADDDAAVGGDTLYFKITKFNPKAGVDDAYFTFNKKSFPGVSVNDLR